MKKLSRTYQVVFYLCMFIAQGIIFYQFDHVIIHAIIVASVITFGLMFISKYWQKQNA